MAARERHLPIGPLSPELKTKLGPPESIPILIDNGLDGRANAWLLGTGEIGSKKRGTRVKIWITPGGTLLTNVTTWQSATFEGDFDSSSSHGQWHETPQAALDWLIRDGGGKLGTASKEAWKHACTTFEPMLGMHETFIP